MNEPASPFARIIDGLKELAGAAKDLRQKVVEHRCVNCGTLVLDAVADARAVLCRKCGEALAAGGARIVANAAADLTNEGVKAWLRDVLAGRKS